MSDRRIRVLIADDSASMRALIRTVLAPCEDIEVVGEAEDGVAAVDQTITLSPDLVTVDIVMPRLDGLGAIAAIMAQVPTRILIVADTSRPEQAELAFRAMDKGALEVIPKAHGGGDGTRAWAGRLISSIRLMAEVPVVHRHRPSVAPAGELRRAPGARVDVIGIVASTGGPPALAQILGGLAPDFQIPILIAQHLAQGFVAGLARWLGGTSRVTVEVAREGAAPLPGHAYLAPGDRDLVVDSRRRFVTPEPTSSHRPNGDRLLASLSQVYGSRAAGVVLTGMGSDGASGLLEVRRAGGFTLAQDEGSSVVYGMPRAAHSIGAAEQQIPLSYIAMRLMQLTRA
jgi:two-component system, chemotaxis family, protein-glutamate methylesterase/glutaminase